MFQALGAWGEGGEESCFWPCCFWKELWRILILRWWTNEGVKGCLFEKWKSESCIWLFATPWTVHSPWNSPGKNTGVGSHSLLLGIFPAHESNWGLLHCRSILYELSYQGSPLLKGRWAKLTQVGGASTVWDGGNRRGPGWPPASSRPGSAPRTHCLSSSGLIPAISEGYMKTHTHTHSTWHSSLDRVATGKQLLLLLWRQDLYVFSP